LFKKRIFDKKTVLLLSSLLVLVIWYLIAYFVSGYIIGKTDENWDEILKKNILSSEKITNELFNDYQNNLNDISENITLNTDVRINLEKNNPTGIYEAITKVNNSAGLIYEIYNKNLILVSFRGRQLNPEIIHIQTAINGEKFSVIRNLGFYTYLIIYSPVKALNDEGNITGVLVVARLIDIKSQIRNKFFPGMGLSNEIRSRIDAEIELISTDSYLSTVPGENNYLSFSYSIELEGIDKSKIGRIDVREFDKQKYQQTVKDYVSKIYAVLSFVFSLIIIGLYFILTNKINENIIFVRIIIFAGLIFFTRLIWLFFGFPSNVFETSLFTPQYFASSTFFGFGKSVGDLFVSFLMILIIIIYSAKLYSSKDFIFGVRKNSSSILNKLEVGIYFIPLTFLFFFTFNLLGVLFAGILTDSNINFLDKVNFLPSADLFFVYTIILIITFSFLFINSSAIIILLAKVKNKFSSYLLRKYVILILFSVFFLINIITECIIDFKVSFITRTVSVLMIFLFAFYIHRYSFLKRNFRLFNFKNFMIIFLLSVFLSPIVMIEKLYHKEPEFIELLGKTLSNQEEERAVFLISNELLNFEQNRNLESMLRDRNRLPELSYMLWTESRISSENFNSAFIIIDSNKKILSDFNISPATLDVDSVVNYVSYNFLNKPYDFNIPLESVDSTIVPENESNAEEYDFEFYPIAFENVKIFKNKKENYYIGITAIERSKISGLNKNPLGFVIIVLQSDIGSIVQKSSRQFFKPYSQDNLLSKLISTPQITEIQSTGIEVSSDIEISREVMALTPDFLNYVNATGDKKMWREIETGGEKYNTFLILAEPKNTIELNEKPLFFRVFAISVNRFDSYIISFYYLRYILLGIMIITLIYLIYAIIFIYKIKNISFNFRNKLFIAFLVISVIPITILGLYTRSFIIKKNDQNTQNLILSDINLVSEVLTSGNRSMKIRQNPDTSGTNYKKIIGNYFLKTDKNLNVFVNDKLITTTNDELYKSDLLDTRIDADALYNIMHLRKDYFVKNQEAGSLTYLEGYKPILDNRNNIKGIISSLSVYKEKEISEELTETLIFILGSYFLVIFFILFLVTVFAERLSKPVQEVKEAADKISKGETNVEIKLKKRSDELGGLVDSFNDMARQLEKSKEKLKRAEREAAWRDIAQRVAHEIKNPLTPMKLSIQHLIKAFDEKSENDFGKVLEKTEKLIINEIDKLNRIATEFSNFAKLPSRNYEIVNINEIIEEVLSLYISHKNISFEKYLRKKEILILADRQEINRVFHNLFKNATQAIEKNGIITVKSFVINEFAAVEIEDNCSGIEPDTLKKIFEPNFSIKSSGMGLGLAITKKSLDDMKARIDIKSKFNIGTKVTLYFNIYRKNDI